MTTREDDGGLSSSAVPAGCEPADALACPFRGYETTVLDTWLDYNGHMTDSAYAVVCAEANEIFLVALDLSAGYRSRTGCTTYTVESRIRYLREATRGEYLRAETVLVRADEKRLLVHTTILNAGAHPVATGEYLFLHLNQSTGRVEPFSQAHADFVQAVASAHEPWPRPGYLGLGVWGS